MNRVRRFAWSVRYTKPSQLAARLGFVVKRKVLEAIAPHFDLTRGLSKRGTPTLASQPPKSPFAPRRDLVSGDGDEWTWTFLAVDTAITWPIDWRQPAWTQGRDLKLVQLHSMEWVAALDDISFVRAIEDWIAHVPPYRKGYARAEWNSFSLSIRVVTWMQQIAARGRRLPLAFVDRCALSIAEQMRFLASNLEHDIGGNHLLKNIKALLWAGRFFDGSESETWSRTGAEMLAREIDEQMLADGVHYERSPAYHAQVTADLIECRSVLGDERVRTQLDACLERAIQALADLTHPDDCVSLFNDGGLHMAHSVPEILAAHARASGSRPIAHQHVVLDHAGYYGYRDGKTFLLFDCGALAPDFLPAHGHGDALSFEWTLYGERIFVDAGVHEYAPGPMREFSRSTSAHNTVTLDDRDQSEFYSSFRVARRARVTRSRLQLLGDGIVVEGWHDGYAHLAGQPIHRRLIRATANDIRIEDHVEGGAGQKVCARLLCHPTARLTQSKDGVVTITQGRVQVRVVSESPLSIVDSWWCPDFGLKLKTKQIVAHYGDAPRVGLLQLRSLVSAPTSSTRGVRSSVP